MSSGIAVAMLACALGITVGFAAQPDRVKTGQVPSARLHPEQVVAGGWTRLSVTVTAGPAGIHDGVIDMSVPSRWPAPSTQPGDAGYVTASAGIVRAAGRSVLVRRVNLAASSRLAITYGGGSGGATEPTVPGTYAFRLTVAATGTPGGAAVGQSLWVRVRPPPFGCRTAIDPVGAGPSLPLPNGVVRPNIYNAHTTAGAIEVCYGQSGASARIALGSESPIAAGPLGYPEVAYGYHLFDQPFCPTCHTPLFPLAVSTLRRFPTTFSVSASYSVARASPDSLPRDFIYDLWLERRPSPGREPTQDDLELAVFLYRNAGPEPCMAGTPASALAVPAVINGLNARTQWTVCRIVGGTPATAVAFLLTDPAESSAATITLPIAPFIDSAARFAGADVRRHWLMGIELGGEVDQCDGPSGCSASALAWSWRVSRLIFEGPRGVVPIVFPVTR